MALKIEMSAAEICNMVKEAEKNGILLSIPSTPAGIGYRAKEENWEFIEIPTKGGKNGVKKVYALPNYVVEELGEKGLLHLIEHGTQTADTPVYRESPETPAIGLSGEYAEWAARQDTAAIVPVRYYTQVFASAGNGRIQWDTDPEAMWFRASFFKHLGINARDCFCTRIDGDSMFPTLIDQGTALWQAVQGYTREGIYLFRQHEELRVKRLQRLNAHTFRVISDNANKSIYPTSDLDLSESDPHDFEILGRYLWSCGISK